MNHYIEIDFNGSKLPVPIVLHERICSYAELSGADLTVYIENILKSHNYEKFKNINSTPEQISMLLALYEFCIDIEKSCKEAIYNINAPY